MGERGFHGDRQGHELDDNACRTSRLFHQRSISFGRKGLYLTMWPLFSWYRGLYLVELKSVFWTQPLALTVFKSDAHRRRCGPLRVSEPQSLRAPEPQSPRASVRLRMPHPQTRARQLLSRSSAALLAALGGSGGWLMLRPNQTVQRRCLWRHCFDVQQRESKAIVQSACICKPS